MTGSRQFRRVVYVVVAILLSACAALQRTDPLQVTVAGIEPMQGQGMELRMLVKLRVQNPNDAAIDYNGVSVKIDVQGKTFATGVSDVFVNGVQVLKDGTHTGAKPGRVVHGPGWTGWPDGGACH